MYNTRSTTIDLSSGASSTGANPIRDAETLTEMARSGSESNHLVILGDCGGDQDAPPERPMVIAVNGVVYWLHFTDEPCHCPEEE